MSFGHEALKFEGQILYSPMFTVHHGIVIPIPMRLSGLLDEFFAGELCHI